ncbi:hypothetical protein VTJ83DRAFT_419 [Remersonia thermophila]|uniref:Uncharacterized protein n=1 Tax=Remersonia thermophila TaxID=72144 RepID=A0ABR4DKW9_9PEZI
MAPSPLTQAPLSTFLPLAPSVSESAPRRPSQPDIAAGSETINKRRTSSSASTSSTTSFRFLRLGPVHDGEHLGGEKGDYSEVAVE